MNSMVTPGGDHPEGDAGQQRAPGEAPHPRPHQHHTMTPAQNSRSNAAPSGPTRSKRPMDAARPSCTHSMEAAAIPVPARAAERAAGRAAGWGLHSWVQ